MTAVLDTNGYAATQKLGAGKSRKLLRYVGFGRLSNVGVHRTYILFMLNYILSSWVFEGGRLLPHKKLKHHPYNCLTKSESGKGFTPLCVEQVVIVRVSRSQKLTWGWTTTEYLTLSVPVAAYELPQGIYIPVIIPLGTAHGKAWKLNGQLPLASW